MADAAFFLGGDGDAPARALGGFFESDFHGVLQVRALVVLLARAAAPAAEHLAEYVAEIKALRAAESAESAAEPARTRALLEGGVADLVVHGAFFFVRQGVVGFLHVFEFFFGRFVAGVAVGVVFHRQFAVGFFDFVVARAAGYAEGLVVVLVAHVGVFAVFCGKRRRRYGRRREN